MMLKYYYTEEAWITYCDSIIYSPTSGRVIKLETGRREVPGSNPGCACRPSHSEFSVVFSETRVNMG